MSGMHAVHSQYRKSRALAWTTGQHQRIGRPTHYGIRIFKTVILTIEAQPPTSLVTKDGLILKVVDWNHGQKRKKCILTACGGMMQHLDFAYHMEKTRKVGTQIVGC